jgi:hypothetical protein
LALDGWTLQAFDGWILQSIEVEAVVTVEAGESSAMAFRDTLLETVGLAGLGTDLMVLFFSCDLF